MKKFAENIISSGIILAILTFIGYVLAYQYDMAYIGYFGIPTLFVNIEINRVIAITVAFVVMSLAIMWFCVFVLNFIPYKKDTYFGMPILCTIAYGVISISISVFQFFYGEHIKGVWGWTFISVGAIWFFYLLYPLLTQRKIKGLRNKFDTAYKSLKTKKNESNTKETYLSKLPVPIILIFLFFNVIFFLALLVNGMGKINAERQNVFSCSDQYENYYLISLQDDNAILAQYENNSFTKSYLIVPQSELGYMKQVEIK